MAGLTIRPEETRSILNKFVESYRPAEVTAEEVGYVVFTADDITHVEGLPGAMVNKLLTLEDDTVGLAMSLEERRVGIVVPGSFDGVDEGQIVCRADEALPVPVSGTYLGRVVGPLGRPIDGLGEIKAEGRHALEPQAPGVMTHEPVRGLLQTGLKAVGSMTLIGCGQRQLIIGDHQAGGTAVTLDTVLNQKEAWESGDPNKQVRCIYATTGQKGFTITAVRTTLEGHGILRYTTIVASLASDPTGLKYLSPCTGSAIDQHRMCQGKHVLVVFDSPSKQAEAYRTISLLLRRPPDREAYPGDVLYLHSRLLECCFKLSDELGTGSMAGLPIIETKANDVSVYIPTSVISITDEQIFLQSDLFGAGQRPAVGVGISVSCVGSAVQAKAMKRVTRTLKITLAQYRSMQAFAMFVSDLDAATCVQLTRSKRLMELSKQPQYTPYPVAEQTASVWTGTKGYLDNVNISDVLPFEAAFLDHLWRNTDILDTTESTGRLTDETKETLIKAVKASRCTFASGEQMLGARAAESGEEPTVERTIERLMVEGG